MVSGKAFINRTIQGEMIKMDEPLYDIRTETNDFGTAGDCPMKVVLGIIRDLTKENLLNEGDSITFRITHTGEHRELNLDDEGTQ